MIEASLIETAKVIRTEYIYLTKELDRYMNEAKKLAEFLNEKCSELKSIDKSENLDKISKMAISKFDEVEDKICKYANDVENINKKIEILRKQENDLYKTIKLRNPGMSDTDILKEVQNRI